MGWLLDLGISYDHLVEKRPIAQFKEIVHYIGQISFDRFVLCQELLAMIAVLI